jgi:ATP-dependent Clp endopeptidase proteolytic subunit ClpP
MAHEILIQDTIGWDTTVESVKSELKKAKGEDVELRINSPGGYVFDGIAIFNAIKDYKGKVTAIIDGLAASMASYIPLAADEIIVRENSVYMIHNAWAFAAGDHNDLRKSADRLEKLTGLLIKGYVAKTGKSTEEIEAMLNEETFLYGDEIVDLGFGDTMIDAEGDIEARDDTIELARMAVEECNGKLEKQKEDLEKAAALIQPIKSETKGAAHTPKAPKAKTQPKREEQMSLETLLKDNPEAKAEYESALAEAKKVEAVVEEPKAEGVNALALTVLKSDSYASAVKEIAANVIEGKEPESTLRAVVTVADMYAEKENSDAAQEESAELGETPGEQPKDSGVDAQGKITSVVGLKAEAQRIKGVK